MFAWKPLKCGRYAGETTGRWLNEDFYERAAGIRRFHIGDRVHLARVPHLNATYTIAIGILIRNLTQLSKLNLIMLLKVIIANKK